MLSLKALLISVAVICTALGLAVSDSLPLLWSFLLHCFTPPYLYVTVNAIINSLFAFYRSDRSAAEANHTYLFNFLYVAEFPPVPLVSPRFSPEVPKEPSLSGDKSERAEDFTNKVMVKWRQQWMDLLRRHEVFLSFRGKDCRASFISHLHDSLKESGIKVFKDDDSLKRGDHISTSLLLAIEQSRISIIVFSRNYADSRWCLEELVKIMEWHRTEGQVVLPVFYNIDPSEVRHQTGEFGNAFQNLLDRVSKKGHYDVLGKALRNLFNSDSKLMNLERSWREALREAAGLAGFVVLNFR